MSTQPDPTVDHTGRKIAPQQEQEWEEEEYQEPVTELMKQRMDEVNLAQKSRHLSLMRGTVKRRSMRHKHFGSILAQIGQVDDRAAEAKAAKKVVAKSANPKSDEDDSDSEPGEIVAVLKQQTKGRGHHTRSNSNPIRDKLSLLFNTALGERAPLLPRLAPGKENVITLVLDMDETLIHSEGEELIPGVPARTDKEYIAQGFRPPDFQIDVPEFGQRFGVYKRPFVDDFLRELTREFEVVVFTAGCEEYASRLLDLLDPKGHIHHRLYRQHTVRVGDQNYVKDMTCLDRDIRRIVLVDNSWYVMEATPDNCIPIKDFYGDLEDRELPRLLSVCVSLKDEKDVRKYLKRTFSVSDSLQRLNAEMY